MDAERFQKLRDKANVLYAALGCLDVTGEEPNAERRRQDAQQYRQQIERLGPESAELAGVWLVDALRAAGWPEPERFRRQLLRAVNPRFGRNVRPALIALKRVIDDLSTVAPLIRDVPTVDAEPSDELSELARECLKALVELFSEKGNSGSRDLIARKTIASRLKMKGSNSLKRELRTLVKLGYTQSCLGSNGGYMLTDKGREWAKRDSST